MMNSIRFRRFASFAGLLAAAAASVATTQEPNPSSGPLPPADTEERETQLDATAPEAVHHFTITSTARPQTVTLQGLVDWGNADQAPETEVQISLRADGADAIATTTVRLADFLSSKDDSGSGHIKLDATSNCNSAPPCVQGYSVGLKMVHEAPGDHVQIPWELRATVLEPASSSDTISIIED